MDVGYKYGFRTEIETEYFPQGLNEEIIKKISHKKNEPEYILDFRLRAYEAWKRKPLPTWSNLKIPLINFQDIIYYAEPKKRYESSDKISPEILETFNKLGIPLEEKKEMLGYAVDAVFDSVSIKTTYKEQLKEMGIIFCSISEAIREYPELIKKYLGSVVPPTDNFYAALNSAVFSDGTFVYVPKNTKCPIELTTYFRINAYNIGQFERTLIIADEGAYVSYMEGCTAPIYDENQLHAAVVELIALPNAEIKYSTIQNWYPGNEKGIGGIFNLVTKRGICYENAKITWIQVETGSAITWKYPSCILKGDNSIGEFFSVALTNNYQQADTGTKMIHIGKNTRSKITSKSIASGYSNNTFRSLVKVMKNADYARNHTQCESLLIGDKCHTHTFPNIIIENYTSVCEHEATATKINEDLLFYCNQRGLDTETAINLIISGYVRDVLINLPLEFAVEAQKLLELKLTGSIG